jgi:hypothetical protein
MIMKKNINRNFGGVLIILMLTLTVSCSKSWLEPKPLSFFSPENTLINESGFKAALASCANNIRPEWYQDGAPTITEHIFSEVAVEGTTDKFGPAVNMNQLITPDANLNSPDFNRIGWYWENQYIGVRLANTIISRLPGAEFNQALCRGSARQKVSVIRQRAHQFTVPRTAQARAVRVIVSWWSPPSTGTATMLPWVSIRSGCRHRLGICCPIPWHATDEGEPRRLRPVYASIPGRLT